MESVYPENSILNKSILDIIELQESEKDLIWTSVEHLSLSSLGLDEIAWEHLRKQYVLKEDPLYDILVLSIDYIHSLCDSDLLFNNILDSIYYKIKSLTSVDIAIRSLSGISKNNFLSLTDNILSDLPVTPNLWSLNVLRSLTAHRITKLSHLTALITKLSYLTALSEYDIIKISGMNYESINLIKNIWLAISSINAILLEVNMVIPSSFECMIKGWVSKHTKKERHGEIIMRRMGWKGEIETLEQIGQTYGLTRERIRQVESTMLNALRKQSAQNELKPIDMVIDSFLYDAKGILSIHELGVRLSSVFNWPHVPHEDGLRSLIDFLPSDNYCLEDGYIHYTEHICGGCVGIISFLENYFKSHEKILISDLLHLIENHCNTICNHLDAVSGARFTESFIHYLIDNKKLKSFLKIDGDKVIRIDKWNLLKGKLSLVAEQVLKANMRAMHFTEVYNEILQLRQGDINTTVHNVYATLERSPKAILWDTGTFIHIENIKFNFTLIREIENWLFERLNENIPFISSYGAYLNFTDKCIQSGITNELALYSCLRISNDSKLAYPHAPYVFLNIGNVTMPPLPSIVEDFIHDKEGTVSLDEINKFAIGKIFMKNYTVAQILERTHNVVRARHGYYIHTDWLRLEKQRVYELIRHTQSMLSKSGHVSVVKVYNERKINCKLMGIDTPELLYSIMRLFNTGELKLTGFPQITLSDALTSDGLIKNIEQYIRGKNTYCSLQELNDYFVEGLGYSEQRVNSIVYRDRIYRYLKRC
ncbi:MAG TPA: sigma factor-like helix-turn-helix DNA-binding protein, partial [Nitrososphaerales archaeon]